MSQVLIYFKDMNQILVRMFHTKIPVEFLLMNFDVLKSNTHPDDIQHFY